MKTMIRTLQCELSVLTGIIKDKTPYHNLWERKVRNSLHGRIPKPQGEMDRASVRIRKRKMKLSFTCSLIYDQLKGSRVTFKWARASIAQKQMVCLAFVRFTIWQCKRWGCQHRALKPLKVVRHKIQTFSKLLTLIPPDPIPYPPNAMSYIRSTKPTPTTCLKKKRKIYIQKMKCVS